MSKKMRKMLVMISAMSLVAIIAVGGTIAWLTAETEEVVNTFAPAGIKIDLYETKMVNGTTITDADPFKTGWKAQMIPGMTYPKNPVVKVTGNSNEEGTDVPLYVFVKIENAAKNYIDYSVNATDWTPLGDTYEGVYYTTYDDITKDESWNVLSGMDEYTDGAIKILDKVSNTTTEDLGSVELKFTAYAIQKAAASGDTDLEKAISAWDLLNP